MALCFDNGRCPWLSCSLVEAGSAGEASSLNGISAVSAHGNSKSLQPDEDVTCLLQADALAGIKGATSAYPKSKRSNRSVARVPVSLNCKSPSCVLGTGTATPDRVFPMSDFARDILHGFGENDTPAVREFSARVCKLITTHLPASL